MADGIDVWMMTVRCGSCERPMTLAGFDKLEGGWNRYSYLCEQGCPEASARALVDVPRHLDLGSRRREEVDYPSEPDGFRGPWAAEARDEENPSQGVFIADPPEDDGR